ncbi:uncharacterized protein LOC105210768 [Zeugodacus cucurbitae]|uniref:uncharacterized protein LOC105210768 n=1 Tax=Zeugodacus cucurbitae TaxID=28588 RepID=UPI00059680B1|nr:uncharacterized protein LOC105210768 [Zeugodacus cucurbitae]
MVLEAAELDGPTATLQLNTTFVIELIHAIYELYLFKNFVLYISEQFDHTESAVKFFDEFFAAFPLVPSVIVVSSDGVDPQDFYVDVLVSKPALSLVFTTGPNDSVMTMAAESMKRVRILKTIFILTTTMELDAYDERAESDYANMINETYTWIWREQFLSTILLTVRDNIYILQPYPELKIVNKTENWLVKDFFIDYYDDLKGYVLNTVIRYDLPRVFDRRYENEVLKISGTSGELFTAFLKSINATLVDSDVASSPFEPAVMGDVIELIVNRTIELSPHSQTALFAIDHVGTSYPIGINDWCIMVPYYNRSPEHLYLLRSFQNSTWLLVLFAVIYISFALWLCAPQRPREYSNALLQAICSMLSIAPTTFFNTPNLRMSFLFFYLFVLGFITSNWYSTKIASYLMTSLPSAQIDTVDDVVRANLRIKVFDYEYDRLESMPAQYPPRFLQQLDIVDKQFMDQHRDIMNTSYGYSIQTDRWEFLNMQQQFLQKPLFRLSDICMGPFHHVFPMYADSHLQIPLKYFIMHATQSGLLTYWQKSAFAEAVRLRLVKILLLHEDPRPLSMRFLRPIWYVWWLGLILAFLVFLCELKSADWMRLKLLRLLRLLLSLGH